MGHPPGAAPTGTPLFLSPLPGRDPRSLPRVWDWAAGGTGVWKEPCNHFLLFFHGFPPILLTVDIWGHGPAQHPRGGQAGGGGAAANRATILGLPTALGSATRPPSSGQSPPSPRAACTPMHPSPFPQGERVPSKAPQLGRAAGSWGGGQGGALLLSLESPAVSAGDFPGDPEGTMSPGRSRVGIPLGAAGG